MKTLEQFYNELYDNEELREGLLQALKEKQTETLNDVVGGMKTRAYYDASKKSSKGYSIADWLRIIWILL